VLSLSDLAPAILPVFLGGYLADKLRCRNSGSPCQFTKISDLQCTVGAVMRQALDEGRCASYNLDSAQMIAAGFAPESSDDWLSLKINQSGQSQLIL
jgi:hypothetical protein